jgi:hypothetical protein
MASEIIELTQEVRGLAPTLRTLSKVDRELRKQVIREMRGAAKPMVAEARSLYPPNSALASWGSWRGGYDQKRAQRGVKTKLRTSSRSDQIDLFTLVQDNAAGIIFAMAGKDNPNGRTSGRSRKYASDKTTTHAITSQPQAFLTKLRTGGSSSHKGFHRPSRAMWPAVLHTIPDVREGLEKAIRDLTVRLNEELR